MEFIIRLNLTFIEDMEDAYLTLGRLEHPGKVITMKELEQALALGILQGFGVTGSGITDSYA